MRFSLRLYRFLLRLYPAGFRENYAGPLEREFRDECAEVRDASGLVRLWLRALLDLAISVPAQVAREIRQDARHAIRLWGRRPVHTAFAILALAVGIGANTGVFSVLNALLLRSLPFREPDRLASLHMFNPTAIGGHAGEFHVWRKQSAYLEDAARYNSMDVNVDGVREASRIRLAETSWNFFSLLGSHPVWGRAFAPEEDTPGRDSLAVIGYGLWQQLFGGDPRALGSTIRLNGVPLTVVGIAPPGFDYPQRSAVWTPTTFDWERIPKTGVNFLENIGRLKPGLSWTQAGLAFEAEAFRRSPARRNADLPNRPALVPMQEQLAGGVRKASLVLMGLVALILLLACANVANLLLARTADRADELMIRSALGASRVRLTQQMLTESVLMSLIAAIAGLLVAAWTVRVASAVQPAPLSGQSYTILDWRVLGFAVLVSVLAGLVFGVGPAWQVGRTKSSAIFVRSMSFNASASRTRNALIAVQIALTIVLLTGSLALGRAFVALLGVDNGYEVRDITTLSVSLAGSEYERGDRSLSYYQEVLRRVREIPGVLSASATEFLPLGSNAFMGGRFTIDGAGTPSLATVLPVAPGYFRTMGGRVLYGREFEDRDANRAERLAIVSEDFARNFGDPRDVLGRFVTGRWGKPGKIVGVVRAMRYAGPSSAAAPQVFLLSRSPNFLTFIAKVRGNPRTRMAAIRDAMQSVDPRLPIFNVKTMEERLDGTLARPKFYATAMLFFGGFALLLAVIGVYGTVSYAVLRRTHEMGVRLALGATPVRVRAALLRQGLVTVSLGVAPGVVGAIAAGRYLKSLIAGAESLTPDASLVAVLILAVVAALGIWSATRRITSLDITGLVRAE